MILDLTPTVQPRTFQSLIELSFVNQGYSAFDLPNEITASKGPLQQFSYQESMLCHIPQFDMALYELSRS